MDETHPLIQSLGSAFAPRGHLVGACCVCVVVFLQYTGIMGLDLTIKHDNTQFLHMQLHNLFPLLATVAVITYILPILYGLYADTILGTYKAILIGFSIKTIGNLLMFSVIVKLSNSAYKLDPTLFKVLVGVYIMGLIMVTLAIVGTLPVFLSFVCQQAALKTESISSVARWGIWAVATSALVNTYLANISPVVYTQAVSHAVSLSTDVVSLAIVVLGRRHYRKTQVDNGRQSFRHALGMLKRFMTCCWKGGYAAPDPSVSHPPVTERLRRTIERLRIKKAVLMVPLLSAVAVAVFAVYLLNEYVTLNNRQWPLLLVHGIKGVARAGVFFIFHPIVEITRKLTGFHFWQNSLVNQLKSEGAGFVLIAAAMLVAGGVAKVQLEQDYELSVWWLIPQFMLAGVAVVLIIGSVMTVCYTESPPGLTSFVLALAMCLGFLFFIVGIILKFGFGIFDLPYFHRYDILSYGTSGVVLAVLAAVYIPVSISILKTDRAISELKENLEE